MFTPAETHALFTRVFDRLVEKGWIHKLTFTQGKGWHVGWSERGTLAAIRLKQWDDALAISEADERPLIFDELAQGITLHPLSNATTLDVALSPLVNAGLAEHVFVARDRGVAIAWTPAGLEFLDALNGWLGELGLHGDEDGLIAFFQIIQGWAPDGSTRVKFQ